MFNKQLIGVLLIVGALLPRAGWALDVDKATAHAQSYVDAFKKKDWNAVSRLQHPSVVKSLRKKVTEALSDEQRKGKNKLRSYLFGFVPSLKPILAMSDEEFFVVVFRNLVGRNYGGTLQLQSIDLLGRVAEGENLVHFVARMRVDAGDRKVETVSAESLLADDEGYGMLLNAQLQGAIDRVVLFMTASR